MAGDAAARDILIHHPAAHADEVIFGPLADPGDLDRLERQPGRGDERMRARDFERGRGAQAGSDRDVGPNDEIGAAQSPSALLQHERDAEDIVGPVASRDRGRGIKIELARLVHDHRVDPEPPVGPRRRRGQGGEFERRRHDEAIVIVGMLADQIDAAGRAADRWHAAKAVGELHRQVTRLNAHFNSSHRRTGRPAGAPVKRDRLAASVIGERSRRIGGGIGSAHRASRSTPSARLRTAAGMAWVSQSPAPRAGK